MRVLLGILYLKLGSRVVRLAFNLVPGLPWTPYLPAGTFQVLGLQACKSWDVSYWHLSHNFMMWILTSYSIPKEATAGEAKWPVPITGREPPGFQKRAECLAVAAHYPLFWWFVTSLGPCPSLCSGRSGIYTFPLLDRIGVSISSNFMSIGCQHVPMVSDHPSG